MHRYRGMWTRLRKEISARHVPEHAPPRELVTEAELDGLPPAARSWMSFFRVTPGTPKRWSFRLAWTGRFRTAPNRTWMQIHAVQYDRRLPVARIFHMKALMGHLLPVLARDTYVDGHGRMLAKVAGLVTVADGRGKEFDEGELVTWLNDAVLFAPTMLLGPDTGWWHVDARAFDVAVSDRGCTVRARVFVDEHGAPVDFETTDRYVDDPADPKHLLVRAPWSTPIEGWRWIDRHPFPVHGRAVWHLDRGDFTYAELEPVVASLAFDVPPSTGDLTCTYAAA